VKLLLNVVFVVLICAVVLIVLILFGGRSNDGSRTNSD
jgi:hypothetical protein